MWVCFSSAQSVECCVLSSIVVCVCYVCRYMLALVYLLTFTCGRALVNYAVMLYIVFMCIPALPEWRFEPSSPTLYVILNIFYLSTVC